MSLDPSAAALQAKNEQLTQEKEQLKLMLSLLQENQDMKAKIQSFSGGPPDDFTETSNLWQKTVDEQQFRRVFQQTKTTAEHRASSPIDFQSFLQSCAHRNTDETAALQGHQTECHLCVSAQPRVIGEMVFQLDRRILSHIFQAQTRLYGFTLRNIPEKIEELSTHPLTGKVDMGYRHHLSQRHTHLMSKLSQLGYKAALHPLFSEFIVNTYGILKERPGENSPHGTEYNDPDLLRRLIVTTTPQKMHKDLHVLLTCLCYMAEQDRKLLMLW
uniref:Spermatogenesis and centriole associated 1-like n=1 Tax=Nothobranchius kuhntae TaxID=321403 RepID=A0A1A8I965_NOTKU